MINSKKKKKYIRFECAKKKKKSAFTYYRKRYL